MAKQEDTESRLVHGEITNRILKAAYKVHSALGAGLLEKPYRVCLRHEFTCANLAFETEKTFDVEYDGITIDCAYRVVSSSKTP